MKISEINKLFFDIKNTLMQGRTDSAIEKLKNFVSLLDDDELENQLVSLSSRYNRLKREKIQGTISEESKTEINTIDSSLLHLLRETKQVAVEEASLAVGEQLSELAQEGENAIEELKQLTYIMAESRLLELRVFRSYLGSFFSEKDVENFDRNINSL
jgi:FMN phosphatase YigB (HAD superfamily)